ncbi:zinc-finger domain-containing protein [Neobacillus notoginsengisoli]|uniref:Zinc-finger domain-containing protein n=1 Tax=Neobacillus notoginsengisoli TaxID=1578198 RepID=A0A417YY51_9BACI|nr:zinc-finger domain-containing protein [Neobacillus notoginsengisoli]RHW42285.1 zinc-finger domain-containing protein [Neobacillus notoginsengisoli]
MEKETIDRKQLLHKINCLFSEYCEGCFLQKVNSDEGGKRKSHKFCISKCTVGGEIRELGSKLTGKKKGKK